MAKQAAIARAIKSHPRVANGGTTAPPKPWGPIGQGRALRPVGAPKVGGLGQNTPVPTPPQAAAAPPAARSAPWNSQYELAVSGANSKYAQTNTGLDYKKTGLEQEYGLDTGYNDFATNPYSRAALLEQSYLRANRGTNNSSASSGQLYAGSTQNAMGYNRGAADQEHNNLESGLRNAKQEIINERLAAEEARNATVNEAGWRRLEGVAGEELDSTTAPEASAASRAAKKQKPSRPKQNTPLGRKGKK